MKRLDGSSLTALVYGVFEPPICLITLVTNFFVCLVLMKKKMRNPTSVLLVALAMSDTLTSVTPLPFFLYFYTTGLYKYYLPYVPYHVCPIYVAFQDVIPTIFHTCSIWLTVTLALQRYLFVCHPIKAKRLGTVSKTVKVIIFVFVMSVLVHSCKFFDNTIINDENDMGSYESKHLINGCYLEQRSLMKNYNRVYIFIYYFVIRIFFIYVLPCLALVIVNHILIREMKKARERRIKLLKMKLHGKAAVNCLCESHTSTMMLVVVVGMFLVLELPLAIFYVIMVAGFYLSIEFISQSSQLHFSILLNLLILISYPINFFIYCIMSKSFRTSFIQLF
ncbi:hypothetical protein HELRODRAFT_66983, partial [Helobdella robusta]|uniref:G-protein coupled receptors family 1 profile domain-containing protein n=1 Tax=Helobdella robusta TaxID=6412 RepID=T1FYU6_HELRO